MLAIEAGQVLAGEYRVEQVLGQGGMGVVLAAQHLELETKVALKLLLSHAAFDEAAQARFLREARASVRLKNDHIAQVFDVGRLEDGTPFIVMEHLAGSDLSKHVEQRGPLSIVDAVDYCVQACEAIAEAHSVGIVHRDLKPANLFLTRGFDGSPCIKVLDFGISKVTGSPNDAAITSTSATMGSPLYMSPEQVLSARDADNRTDIWALGTILCELLTGKPPFTGETLGQVLLAIAQHPVPSLRERRADLPAELEAVVRRCLEKDRAARFQDVRSLVQALAPFGSNATSLSLDRISRLSGLAVSGSGAAASGPAAAAASAAPGAVATGHQAARGAETGSGWGGTRPPDVVAPRPRPWGLIAASLAALFGLSVFGGFLVYDRKSPAGAATVSSAPSALATPQPVAPIPPPPAAVSSPPAVAIAAQAPAIASAAAAKTDGAPAPPTAARAPAKLGAPAPASPAAKPSAAPVTPPRRDLFMERE
jgi:serine/threonine-protein kinase